MHCYRFYVLKALFSSMRKGYFYTHKLLYSTINNIKDIIDDNPLLTIIVALD